MYLDGNWLSHRAGGPSQSPNHTGPHLQQITPIETLKPSIIAGSPPSPLLISPVSAALVISSRTAGEVMRSSKWYVLFSGALGRFVMEKIISNSSYQRAEDVAV